MPSVQEQLYEQAIAERDDAIEAMLKKLGPDHGVAVRLKPQAFMPSEQSLHDGIKFTMEWEMVGFHKDGPAPGGDGWQHFALKVSEI